MFLNSSSCSAQHASARRSFAVLCFLTARVRETHRAPTTGKALASGRLYHTIRIRPRCPPQACWLPCGPVIADLEVDVDVDVGAFHDLSPNRRVRPPPAPAVPHITIAKVRY